MELPALLRQKNALTILANRDSTMYLDIYLVRIAIE